MSVAPAIAAKQREMNLELSRMESIFLKERLVSMPQVVQLPTGTRCNLRCVFCTDRNGPAEAGYRDLTLEEFLPMAEGLHWASIVQLWGWGEPFLNPHYRDIFSHVSETHPGIEINISTNGTLFDATWQKKLLDHGNFSVNVSVNAANSATYERITGVALFDRMAENLRSFGRKRQTLRAGGKARFTVSFVVVRENMHEISDFIDLAAQFGVDHVQYMDLMNINSAFAGISATDYGDEVKALFDTAVSRASSLGISVGSFIPYSSSSSLAMKRYAVDEASSTGSETAGYAPCYEPWRNILVCSDGTATLCCRSGVVTGNLLKDGLEGVWNSDTYQFYRKRVNSPTPPEACRSCPVKMGMSS